MKSPNLCGGCIYFNALHQCCGVRLKDEDGLTSYLHREPTSEACRDFNVPDLPEYFQTQQTPKELAMTNDDRDWRASPIVHVYTESDQVRIVGAVKGDLLYAIAMAMGKGTGQGGLLLTNLVRYPVIVERKDYENEWQFLTLPAISPVPKAISGIHKERV